MARRPHYIPTNKSNESPSQCIWVDTETRPTKISADTEAHYLDFGMACYRRRLPKGGWSDPDWIEFTDKAVFWDWVESKTRAKTRLYLFAHNGAFDLPVLSAFTQLPSRGWKISNAICDAPPIDISWRLDKKTIRFVDTLNLWRMPLASLGTSVGLRKLRMPGHNEHPARHLAYCRRDVKVIMRACLKWFDFLTDNDLGGFKSTLASQAFGTYRHRFMPHQIAVHNNDRALQLERDSYVGGRTECFKLGKYEGEFYYIDVNSMYPSVMLDNLYPHKLVGCYSIVNDEYLSQWRNQFAIVASVTINTMNPDYPKVHDGKLVFPIGTFDVSLAGPEFWRAYDAGHVVKVHRVAVYEQAKLFTSFVRYFYDQRLAAKKAGDMVNTFNYKILSNSLYGKFGQRGRRFDIVDECDPNIVSVEDHYDADRQESSTVRCFGGIVQQWVTEGESFNSFPAIASYVTSYARLILSDAINKAGRDNCYYCDTDSLVVNRQGWEALVDEVDQDRLGAWGLDTILESMTLHGPKDYVFDDKIVLKGVRANAEWISSDTVEQDQFVGFRGLVRLGSLDAPLVKRITKKQRRIYTKGIPTAAGNVLPLTLGD